MTNRQRMLRRSGVVEPSKVVGGCRKSPTALGGMTTAAVMTLAYGDVECDDFELSPGDSFGCGFGAGAEPAAEQRQETPCEHGPRQQQVPGTSLPQQLSDCVAPGADWLQHEGSLCIPRWPSKQAETETAAGIRTRSSDGCGEGLPQLQTVRGRASTGTSTTASQASTRAAVLLWICTAKTHAQEVC